MKILCIDANSVANRAFYGVKLLTTKDGKYTNAVYGFINILLRALSNQQPDAVAIAFDLPDATFRHAMYDKYKANRKGMPQELAEQIPVLKQLLTALGFTVVSVSGYEADDILGTFSGICKESGWECVIATGDRDSLQLVSESTSVMLTTTQFGKGETALVDRERIYEDYGVEPEQLIEVKALMGDNSDNVPGVAGIGEKTALALIQNYRSLDGVYENINDPAIKEGVRQKLIAGKDSAYLSKQLVTICKTVPVDRELMSYIKHKGEPQKAVEILTSLEIHSLIDRLGLRAETYMTDTDENNQPATPQIVPIDISDMDFKKYYYIALERETLLASNESELFEITGKSISLFLSDDEIAKNTHGLKEFHHFAFDRQIPLNGTFFDTQLAAYLLNPSSPDYSVGRLAAEYGIKPLFLCERAADMGLRQPLTNALKEKLEQAGMTSLLNDIEIPFAGVLAGMERIGFLIDRSGISEFGSVLDKEIKSQQKAVFELVGYEFNLNSPKQLGEALFEKLKLPAGRRTKSGYSTDAEVLDRLRGYHPAIEHILSYRSCSKLNSTYVEGLLKAAGGDGRVHTEFRQTETRTGRISSVNPNLQNIPVRTELGSRLRRFFVAEEGKVLLDADYSQIELRVLASLSEDRRMIDAFLNGMDIHTQTACEIFKLPGELITPELRRRAKAVNFGIVYGIGAFSLSKDVGVSIEEAKDYIDGYLLTYIGVKNYLDKTVEEAQDKGYITTMFGRRRLLPELASANKQLKALGTRLAMNTPIQGTAADIIKIAMIRVRDRLKKENLDAKLILQIHDELIVESSTGDAGRAKEILKFEMENAVSLAAPLEVEVNEGQNWYDAKK